MTVVPEPPHGLLHELYPEWTEASSPDHVHQLHLSDDNLTDPRPIGEPLRPNR